MEKFVIKAFDIRSFEEEIEAETESEAREIFLEKYDAEDIESCENNLFFEIDEGFEVIREMIENTGESEDFED
jgi:hypothetical protein